MKEALWDQTAKQATAFNYLLDQETTELIFGGGAGGAKTFLGCGWLITMCNQYPGTRWLMGRAVLKILKETTLATFFDICKKWDLKEGIDYKYNSMEGKITWLKTGSEILLKDLSYMPSDPNYDSLGSLELTGGFIDEVSEITFRAWSVVTGRIRYKLNEYKLYPKLLGSCNPSKNWLYPEFYKPWRENKLPPHKKFVQALAKDNKFLPAIYIENLKRIKDVAIRERLLNGNWEYDDDPSALMSYDLIMDLFSNKGVQGDKYIIGDVARKGSDRMVVTYWEGLQLKEIHIFDYEIKSDTVKAAKKIEKIAESKHVRRSNILLDEDGVGGGIVDVLGCKGFINNSVAIQPYESKFDETKRVNYANLKAQCAFKFVELAEKGIIGIKEDRPDIKDLIVEELEQLKQKDIDKDGKICLIGKDVIKDNIGRSPDFADTLIMRMYYELGKKEPKMRFI